MSNYSSQRSIATGYIYDDNQNIIGGNGRLIEIAGANSKYKTIAIFPFYLRKRGSINAWEFSATQMDNEEEVGVMPQNFRAILFSCVQAFMDYVKNTYDLDLNGKFGILKHKVNKIEEEYFRPPTYTEKSDPGEFIIIAAHSVRDGEDYTYPVPNCVPVGHTEGNRSYQGDDAEYFWRADDGCYYFGLVEFDSEAQLDLESVRSVIYYE